jgi:hypothetical protein
MSVYADWMELALRGQRAPLRERLRLEVQRFVRAVELQQTTPSTAFLIQAARACDRVDLPAEAARLRGLLTQ